MNELELAKNNKILDPTISKNSTIGFENLTIQKEAILKF